MSRLIMLTRQRNQNYGRDLGAELSAAAEIQSDLLRGLKKWSFLIDKLCRSFQNNFSQKMFKNG